MRVGHLIIYTVVLLWLGGCAGGFAPVDSRDALEPAPPGFHRVRPGDTLYGIARRYRTNWQQLAELNALRSPDAIYAGSLLRIDPDAPAPTPRRRPQTAASAQPSASPATRPQPSTPSTPPSRPATPAPPSPPATAAGRIPGDVTRTVANIQWRWPVEGTVRQTFREGDRTRQGLRIETSAGTMVRAAAAGSVVYSGSGLKGYGNLIIVKHSNDFLSAYGFNRRLIATEGTEVSSGQVLAEVGEDAKGDYLLHFEIRREGVAVDPLRYLPVLR